MKKIFTFLIIAVLGLNIQAQTMEYDTLINQVHQFYDDLDHSTMNSSYLFNRGFVVLNQLEEWNNGYPIITNIERWKSVYQSIESSNVNGDIKFPDFEDLVSENVINSKGISTIGLSILNYRGDYLTASYVEQMAKNNLEPNYTPLNFFAGSVLHQTSFNQEVHFKWNPAHYFTNLNEQSIIEIDFGDNFGFRTINIDQRQSFMISYDCIGEKSIAFRNIVNKDTILSYSKIAVLSLEATKPTKEAEIIIDNSKGQDISNSGKDPEVNLTKANYEYFEGYDNKLDKPVIITEGFDVLGLNSAKDHYENWKPTIERLRNHGYDVFTLNFRAPNKDMVKNAEVVTELIKGINKDKIGNYEGVYIGESMGGVIGRIALKNMENDNYDHQIGLFIPYDSPFKGANIPLGIQWLFRDAFSSLGPKIVALTYLVELFEIISGADVPVIDLYQNMTSKASKQLLVRHFKGNSEYNSFQNYLSNLGYPADSRNVSFINGSNTAQTQGIPLGGKIFQKKLIIGIFNINAQCWYSNVNVTDQTVSKYLYISIFSFPWNWKNKKRKESFNNQPFDNAPGGNINKSFGNDDIKFCFVPSLSAIDINSSNYTNNLDYFNANKNFIIDTNESPFDDIYTPSSVPYFSSNNVSHITHYSGFDYWERTLEEQEIMYDDLYLQNRVIKNNRDFEAEHTIVVGNNVQPSSFNKKMEAGEFIINPATTTKMEAGSSIYLKPKFHAKAGSSFSAKIVPDNGSNKRKKPIPVLPPEIVGNKYFCGENTYSVAYNSSAIFWTLKGNNIEINEVGNKFTVSQQLAAGQYTLYCSNGETSSSKIIIVSSDEQCGLFSQLENNFNKLKNAETSVFPNPSDGLFTLQTEQIEVPQFLTIRDVSGKIVINQNEINTKNTEIDISNLPSGIYFFEVQFGDSIETHKVIKTDAR